MTPFSLAWSNLTQQRVRTLISIIGIAFAVLLSFMQLGFKDAVRRTATLLYDKLDFDLILVSSEYGNLTRAGTISSNRLAQVRSVPGVERVLPLTTVLGLWSEPRQPTDTGNEPRPKWSILVLAVDPGQVHHMFNSSYRVFRSETEMRQDAAELARLDTVLMDRASTPSYGNPQTWAQQPYNELNGRRVEIIGDVRIGTGFAYSGLLMTSETTLSRVFGWPADRVSFGLVKLTPGADIEKTRQQIAAILPSIHEQRDATIRGGGVVLGNVEIRTRKSIMKQEEEFWEKGTSVGQFFTAGVIIALLVGGVFVYQMMAADISRRLPEYATILALGYPTDYLSHVVYWQGFLLAVMGYLPGIFASLLGYWVTHKFASVPIEMTGPRAAFVLALTIAMCMGSALVAVSSVYSADPADLF